MREVLQVDPAEAVPIWKQIEEGVRRLIATGRWAPGSLVPSVREMARDLRVNPATVSKAYQHLSEAGLLSVQRGEGTFVAETLPKRSLARPGALAEGARRYASLTQSLGESLEKAHSSLDQAWIQLMEKSKGATDE